MAHRNGSLHRTGAQLMPFQCEMHVDFGEHFGVHFCSSALELDTASGHTVTSPF